MNIAALLNGETDIANSSRELNEKERQIAAEKGIDVTVHQGEAYGFYGYFPGDEHYDRSNGQYGVLGMWAVEQAGAEVPTKYWPPDPPAIPITSGFIGPRLVRETPPHRCGGVLVVGGYAAVRAALPPDAVSCAKTGTQPKRGEL